MKKHGKYGEVETVALEGSKTETITNLVIIQDGLGKDVIVAEIERGNSGYAVVVTNTNPALNPRQEIRISGDTMIYLLTAFSEFVRNSGDDIEKALSKCENIQSTMQ